MKTIVKLTVAGMIAATSLGTSMSWAQAEEEKILYLYNWTDYFPLELLQKFEKETGIKVTYDGYDSMETMLAKLQSGGGNYDVVVISDWMVPTAIKGGLLQEISASTMPNFNNMKAAFKQPEYDPQRNYTAPYLWGTTGIAYDSAQVPGGKLDDSWKEFFEPRPELAGKIAALDVTAELYTAAAFYAGVDQCTESPEDAKKILEILEKQKPSLKLYSADSTVDRMAAGEVAIHHLWNGATARAQKQRSTIRYIYPKEGVPFAGDNFTVPTGAAHPENAKLFINWMMAPENAAAASNSIAYSNAIESDAFLSDDWRKSEAINMPAEFADRLKPMADCSSKARELRDKVWAKLKS